jgi:RHS repeat-associated protein
VNDLAGAANDDARTFARNPASQIIDRGASNAAYVYAVPSALNQSATFNGLNQPTQIGGATITHDDRGNLTSDGATSYAYDVDNRLVSSSTGASFAWDAIGRLRQTQSGATTTKLYYAGEALIAETNGSGAIVARYVHGAGVDEPLVWYVGAGTGTKRWLTADERGSIASVTDAAGVALAINTYDEYGKPGPNNLGRFQYTGQQWIAELGLYHYKARFYAPGIGRFLQTDPIGYEDQMNLYAYVHNDPVNAIDPNGEFVVSAFVGLVIGAGLEAGGQIVRDGKITDRGAVGRAAVVGAVTGAVGPAGGAALRAGLLGKAGAAAAAKSSSQSAKAVVTLTDTVADVAGQPVVGAIDSAISGEDPGVGATSGVATAGVGVGFDAAASGSSPSTAVKGARGGVVSAAKSFAKDVVENVVADQAATKVEEQIEPEKLR